MPQRDGDALTPDTFDSKQLNWAIFGEFALAVLAFQMDAFNRISGTVPLTVGQFAWALVPPILLVAPWELGKLVAGRSAA